MRSLFSHAAILEDGKGDAGQLETPPSCCRAVEQSDLCPDLQVRKASTQLHVTLDLNQYLSLKVSSAYACFMSVKIVDHLFVFPAELLCLQRGGPNLILN